MLLNHDECVAVQNEFSVSYLRPTLLFGATRWFNTSTMAAGELDEVGRDEGLSQEVACAKDEVVDMNNVQAQLLGRGIPAILGLAY